MKKFLFTLMILTLLIMCMSTTVFANENKYFFTESNGVISWQLKKFSDEGYKPYTGEQISRYILRIYYENQQIPSYKDEYYKTNSFEFQKIFDSLGRVSGHYTIWLQAKDIIGLFSGLGINARATIRCTAHSLRLPLAHGDTRR